MSVPGNCCEPSESGTPRCGQRSFSAYTVPASRKKTILRPNSSTPTALLRTCDDHITGYHQLPRSPRRGRLVLRPGRPIRPALRTAARGWRRLVLGQRHPSFQSRTRPSPAARRRSSACACPSSRATNGFDPPDRRRCTIMALPRTAGHKMRRDEAGQRWRTAERDNRLSLAGTIFHPGRRGGGWASLVPDTLHVEPLPLSRGAAGLGREGVDSDRRGEAARDRREHGGDPEPDRGGTPAGRAPGRGSRRRRFEGALPTDRRTPGQRRRASRREWGRAGAPAVRADRHAHDWGRGEGLPMGGSRTPGRHAGRGVEHRIVGRRSGCLEPQGPRRLRHRRRRSRRGRACRCTAR